MSKKPDYVELDHVLICGVTKCGKTTLAHLFAFAASEEKPAPEIIVYDPLGTETLAGTWPNNTALFDDKEKFLQYLDGATNAVIFVDESDDVFSHEQRENSKIVRRGRHFGWRVVLITQRPKLISPNARNQCSVCYLFRLSRDDTKSVSSDFGYDLPPIDLDRGDFLVLRSGTSNIERHNVFQSLKKGKQLWTASATTSKSPRPSSS